MPSSFRRATATAAYALSLISLLVPVAMAHAAASLGEMEQHIAKRAVTYNGCYSSSQPLTSKGMWMYQSSGYCQGQCQGSPVFAMSDSNTCWCGDQMPPLSDQVNDSNCNEACVGFPSDTCGGAGFYSVYLTGTANVGNLGGDSSSSSSSSATSASSKGTKTTSPAIVVTSTNAGETVVVTIQPTAEAATSNTSKPGSGGGSNTAGIAAGVVVGVVAIAGIIGGLYFFIRHKRRREAEEDFKARTQVDQFRNIGEFKAPGTSYSGMSDQRLDPEAGRRNSVGSLADNQDYSRRILRVANPSD